MLTTMVIPFSIRSRIGLASARLQNVTMTSMTAKCLPLSNVWRHYLEGSKYPIHVHLDHKNLEWFMTTKILNHRQARWAEILSGYNFALDHITGSKNPADGPSRRPNYAENVDFPSGTLIPQSTLRLLPSH